MYPTDDAAYFSARERAERCLAANAQDQSIIAVHLELAGAYRKRALAARERSEQRVHRPAKARSTVPDAVNG